MVCCWLHLQVLHYFLLVHWLLAVVSIYMADRGVIPGTGCRSSQASIDENLLPGHVGCSSEFQKP